MSGQGMLGVLRVMATTLIVLVVSPSSIRASDYTKSISQLTRTSWLASDGIAGPIRAITQSADGYLWLGTEVGLFRFDGVNFVRWTSLSGERLPGSSVWSLCVSKDGSLWVGLASNGISRIQGGRLTNYAPSDGAPAGGVLSIVEDQSGTIWAGGQYGFSKFDGGTWRKVGAELGYAAPGAQALFVDRFGTLFAATDGLNFRISDDPVLRNTVMRLARNGTTFEPTGIAVGLVWSFGAGPDGAVWMADFHRLRPISGTSSLNKTIPLDKTIMCLLFDNSNRLWAGTLDSGLRAGVSHKGAHLSPDEIEPFQEREGLSADSVWSLFKDREGNVWVGTAAGLDRFRGNKVTSLSKAEGLISDQQIALSPAEPRGVWIVNYTQNAVRQFDGDRFVRRIIPKYSANDSSRILSMFSDRAGRLLVGGSFGLAESSGDGFRLIHRNELGIGANVEAITIDSRGALWVAETGWNPRAGTPSLPRILRLTDGRWTDLSSGGRLPPFKSRVLHADAEGRVWMGFENGEVAKYEGGSIQTYSSKDGLPLGRPLAITSDRRGRVWIAGESGLSQYRGGRFATLSEANGLLGSSVSAVVEDDSGYFWIAGAVGILRVSSDELERALTLPGYRMNGLTIGANDGLRGLPRQRQPFPTAALARDGTLWFATSRGISIIDPKNLPTNRVPPPVVIESVRADTNVFNAVDGLHLPPRTRSIELSFTALSLTDPARVQFRYKLKGYDDDWQGPIATRRLTFTNLPPRDYEFQVIASNNDDVWNREGATLAFRILPAYYQTSAFRLAVVGALVLIAWMAYRQRVAVIARRLTLRHEERLSERERIARELHDTLLQGAYGMVLRFQAAAEQIPPTVHARQMMDNALDRADAVIKEARDRVEGLRSGTTDAPELSEAFTRAGNELTRDSKTGLRIMVEGRPGPLHAIVRDEVYWIGREALINAFHSADANQVELELTYGRNELRVRCRDDGRGIDRAILDAGGRPGHWGIQGMRERARRIGAQLEISSRAGAGTEIDLRIRASLAYAQPAGRPAQLFRRLRGSVR